MNPTYPERICRARERLGLTHEEVAQAMNIDTTWYWDIESVDTEIISTLDLRQICKLSEILGLTVWQLVAPDPDVLSPAPLNLGEFIQRVSLFNNNRGLTAEAFSDLSGWNVKDTLSEPRNVFQWNLDQLRDISTAIGIDWLCLLSGGLEF